MDNNNIGFVFTNFNNSRLSIQALDSIYTYGKDYNCYCVIVDNNSQPQEREMLAEAAKISPNIKLVFSESNLGYFKGLNSGIKYLNENHESLKLIVAGNNDLVFKQDFFDNIQKIEADLNTYTVISPDLITLDGEHQNPHVIHSIGRFREFVWDLYFTNFYLAKWISYLSGVLKSFTERKDFMSYTEQGSIYQGYGACYVLTPLFFKHFKDFWSPGFLMGEEFYLAKQIELIKQRMYYQPTIKVYHHDHATVSKIPSKLLWEYSKEYHKIYRLFISPYRLNMNNNKSIKDLNLYEGI